MRFSSYDNYNRREFTEYLQNVKNQEYKTADDNACMIATFLRRNQSPEEFITSYAKPNSYNNALNAIKHYCAFLGVPRPNLKQKRRSPDALIIAPKPEEMWRVIRQINDQGVKTYIALCASVGLRPRRLLEARWAEIDFTNGWVNINERHGKKVYRPNPLHKDVDAMLQELKKTSNTDRVFAFTYEKVQNALKAVGTTIRPNNCRDFFYNFARRSGVDKDLVDWLAGHSIGIRAHYLSDDCKEQYQKFEEKFRLV
jgi:integrase